MTRAPTPVHRIELRLKELARLFNWMDPTPFHAILVKNPARLYAFDCDCQADGISAPACEE